MSSSYNELSYESPYVSPLSNHAYIICEIIRYLNRQVDLASCCQVSKLWNTCAIPSLWRSPKIKHISTLTKFVRTLVRTHQGITMYSYGCMIQHLDLSRVNLACESAELDLIAETCGVLKSINLTNVQHLSEEILSRFSSRCSDLRSLTLLNLPYITDKSMVNVITRCHQLEHLAFGDCLGIKDQSILQLAYSAKNLTTLEIFFKNKIENDSFILVTKNCMRLKNIHIWECELLSDAAITTMAINLNTRLESLILHNIKNITDVSLTQVAIRCTNLRNLGLEPYEGVTNETLIAFADYAKKLESFEISLNKAQNISNDGFIAIADGSKQLSKVTFQSSTLNVTDITLNIISVRSATTLTCLHLYNCSFSDSAFTVLEKARPPINDLCLFTLPNITDDPIIRFLYSISNTLNSLQLSNCESITEECVVSGVSECKLLKKLSLYLSNDFTTRGLDAIVKLRDNLKELSLASIEDIPSEAAAPKLASLRNLGELRIRDCSNLKPDNVLTICCGCHQLEEFSFGCGNYITEEFVQEYNYYGKNRPLLVIGPET